ncbi:MAG: GNAT family N-acetyltransferase [Bacteroidota bacterium]|nr:GNAT family N-acetyltransferase [Bacteroidota bacterium]
MIVHSSFSEIDPIQWHELVSKSPTASFFQTPQCYKFYDTLSFLKPFVFGVTENNKLVGILCGYIISDGNIIKRFFSRRAIVPAGALLDPQITTPALTELLAKATNELCSRSIYLELRNYNDYSSSKMIFEASGFNYLPHLNFHVATPDVETALQNLSSSKRRQIKLTLKAGASIQVAETVDEIKQYYNILQELYKTRVKSPLFPFEFFENLVDKHFGKILLIKYKDKVVGGITCVFLDERVVYEWFVCGYDRMERNLYPSVLATWAGIEYAANNGYERFDFMGAGKPVEGYGVREFKSKFGGELVEHGRFLYVFKPVLYKSGKLFIAIKKTHIKK